MWTLSRFYRALSFLFLCAFIVKGEMGVASCLANFFKDCGGRLMACVAF